MIAVNASDSAGSRRSASSVSWLRCQIDSKTKLPVGSLQQAVLLEDVSAVSWLSGPKDKVVELAGALSLNKAVTG
jgi:hypothetical protein